MDTSCKEGICGTCVMGVLEGEPEHRDNCLSASEKKANDQIATCVSRARSARLMLELF
ncbi:MAG: 2Fe-2S iron-sulfur cluster binding domain-containing protein [Aeromicrobium sp.]